MPNEFDLPLKEITKRMSVQERLDAIGMPEGLTPRQANAITQARLQYALSSLAEMNVDNVHQWLSDVAKNSPAEAIRLYLELLEFRMPRMKAATVIANFTPNGDGSKQLKDMTIEELQSVIAEQ